MKPAQVVLLTALIAMTLPVTTAEADSIYAAEVIAAEADGGNSVVEFSERYITYNQCQPDNGSHALEAPDFWTFEEGSGSSGWLNWAGSLVLRFDYYLKDGSGADLTVYHHGYGSTVYGDTATAVSVSRDGISWIHLGDLGYTSPYSWDSYNFSTSFDLTDSGVDNVNYIRIDKYGSCLESEDCALFIDAVEGHYLGGTDRPVVTLTSGDLTQAPLTPNFKATHWDPDSEYVHERSRWQIGEDSDFSRLVIDQTSSSGLTTYTVPGYLLDTESVYYCRVRFYDGDGEPSPWSVNLSFTTAAVSGEDTTVYASQVIEAVGGIDDDGADRPVVKDQNGVWPTYEADGGIHSLGEPDYNQGGFASGWSSWGGHLIVGFDTPITDLSGVDLVVYHWGPGARDSDRSTAFAYARENLDDGWVILGELSQSDRGVITTDAYDLADIDSLDTVNYVKVMKNYNGTDSKKCGKYIDAIKGNPPQILGQEVDDNGTLTGDWTDGDCAAGRMKFVNPVIDGEADVEAQIGIRIDPQKNSSETTLISVNAVDPISIDDTASRPGDLPVGLVRIKVAVPSPGDEAVVTIYLPLSIDEETGWYQYDTTYRWQDYTALGHAEFLDDRTVRLWLKDGGTGDADLTENGVIVDPGGPGLVPGSITGEDQRLMGNDADTADASGCFVVTLVRWGS